MKILISLLALAAIAFGVYTYAPRSFTEKLSGELSDVSTPEGPFVNRSGENLTKFPSDILAMTDLQSLDISHNALTGAMPAEIRHLQDLEVLNASYNSMTGLPAELGQLKKLRVLDVSHNKLTGLPNELGNLSNLQVLDLSGNDVSQQDLDVIRARLPSSTQIIL